MAGWWCPQPCPLQACVRQRAPAAPCQCPYALLLLTPLTLTPLLLLLLVPYPSCHLHFAQGCLMHVLLQQWAAGAQPWDSRLEQWA